MYDPTSSRGIVYYDWPLSGEVLNHRDRTKLFRLSSGPKAVNTGGCTLRRWDQGGEYNRQQNGQPANSYFIRRRRRRLASPRLAPIRGFFFITTRPSFTPWSRLSLESKYDR